MTIADATMARVTVTGSARPDDGLTGAELLAITGGRGLVRSERLILGGAVDSRLVEPGQLFVALPGEHVDGHEFVAAALAAGAAGVLIGRPVDAADLSRGDATVVLVDDPLRALQAVAAAWRTRFDPLVVGITGSIAKTSTIETVTSDVGWRPRPIE